MSTIGVLFLWVFLYRKKLAFLLLTFISISSWILTLVLSAPFPISLDTTLSSHAISYFKSVYSHLPYYLFGILNGYWAYHDSTKETMFKLTNSLCFRLAGVVIGIGLMMLVVIRPSVW